MLGALEAGGTKMVCAVGDELGNVKEQKVIRTRTPEETMPEMIAFYEKYQIDALGIGCFGPIDINKESVTYGRIMSTPKLAWRGYDILGGFREKLRCLVGIDTDVNAACLGEVVFGAAKGCKNVVYITIGTGVGMGVYSEGRLLHGAMHPEAGHMRIKRMEGDNFKGSCPYHGDCLEGLISGPAMEQRCGRKAYDVPREAQAWDYTSSYIAESIMNLILTLAPEKIILGGGVMEQEWLLPLIRTKVEREISGYVALKEMQDMEQYIVRPACGGMQGVLGGIILAKVQKSSN